MITPTDISAAAERIAPHILRTPLMVAEPMSERTGARVAIKAEHAQRTGSFKIRGALNMILDEAAAARDRGIVTASSGNHGIAVATAARIVGVDCTVFLPTGASDAKVAAIERLGARVETVGSADAHRAEVTARARAEAERLLYVPPYNEPRIVAGQGTIGLEILEDCPAVGIDQLDAVVVAVGGGGLVSGIAAWLKSASPATKIIAASPANDAAMLASVEAGAIVEVPAEPSFSDGTAGGIEADSITFDLCRTSVDEWIAVTEPEIAAAVAAMIDDHHQLVEGAAGVALAAADRYGRRHRGRTVVAVSCGANVSAAALARMLNAAA